MVITSSILFYQLEGKCQMEFKKAPSDKLQIKNIRVWDGRKTEVGALYIVDMKKFKKHIVSRKPVTFVFINADEKDYSFFPGNCDYTVISDIKSEIEMFALISDSMNELQEWDCALKDGLSNRTPLDEYVPIANRVFKDPLFILTRDLSLITFSKDYERIQQIFKGKESFVSVKPNQKESVRDEFSANKQRDMSIHTVAMEHATELLADDDYHKTVSNVDAYSFTDGYDNEYLCMNVFSDNRYIARLLTPIKKYNSQIDEGQLQLFRHFFKYLKSAYLRYSDDPLIKSSGDKLHTLIEEFINNNEEVDALSANLILENYGWSMKNLYSVIRFSFFKNAKWDEITEYICSKLEETWNNSCAIRNEDEIIWVVNHSISKSVSDERKFFHVLAYIVRDFVCKAGVSDKFNGLEKLPSYLLQAGTALSIGQKCDPDRWYFKFSDYALDYMFERIVSEFDIEQLIHTGIRRLIAYDRKNSTDFMTTLKCFLDNNCNSTHTADELYIHRTTLIRRIDRIEEISGIDFNDRETHVYLVISFWILEKLGYKIDSISQENSSQ